MARDNKSRRQERLRVKPTGNTPRSKSGLRYKNRRTNNLNQQMKFGKRSRIISLPRPRPQRARAIVAIAKQYGEHVSLQHAEEALIKMEDGHSLDAWWNCGRCTGSGGGICLWRGNRSGGCLKGLLDIEVSF